VRAQSGRGGARLAAFSTGLALIAAVPVAVGADSTALRAQAEQLRGVERSLGAERQSALLNLFALESELEASRRDAADLTAEHARVTAEHAAAKRRLAVARRSADASIRQLEEVLRSLYQRQHTDPLEILLGSGSLEEALTSLESLEHTAAENRRILERSRATQARLARVAAELAARKTELTRLAQAAAERTRELQARATAKAAYLESLRRRQSVTAVEVTRLEADARAAQEQAAELQTARSVETQEPGVVEAVVAADGTRTLTVSAIGYSLPGRTASGLPVGHGIVAVDPSVIPLGTRLYVPGYGEAVAADTGGAIQGAVIDLWFPTVAEARAWGRQTVVITLG
jgi:peptidoglycan DL-endopeptidase CwlO